MTLRTSALVPATLLLGWTCACATVPDREPMTMPPLSSPAGEPSLGEPIDLRDPAPTAQRRLGMRPRMVGFRFGGLFPTDTELQDVDREIPSFALHFRNRHTAHNSHGSISTGFEYWRADGTIPVGLLSRLDVELEKWTLPVTFGYNTASLSQWSAGQVNVFIGGGFSFSSLYQRVQPLLGPSVYSHDAAFGLHAESTVDVPLGNAVYVSGVARYEWSPSFDHSALPGSTDEVGGFFAGVEIGAQF